MQRDAAEEDGEHGDPLEVLAERLEEIAVLDAITQDTEGDVADEREDEDDGDVDLERVNIVVVEPAVVKSDQEVVEDGEDPGGANGVVCTDVSHDGDFGGEGHVGGEEDHEKTGKRAASEPVFERIKDQFVAAVGIPAQALACGLDGGCLVTYFSQRFSSSYTVRETPSLNPSPLYAARRTV